MFSKFITNIINRIGRMIQWHVSNEIRQQSLSICFLLVLLLSSGLLMGQSGAAYDQAVELRRLGTIELKNNQVQEAKGLFEKALDLAYQTNNDELLATIMDKLAYICEIEGAYDEAIRLIRKSQELRWKTDDKMNMARSWLNLGNVYQLKSMYDSAFICFGQALSLYNDLDELNGKARVYNNLGNIHYYLANYDTAVYYFQKSLTIKEITDDQSGAARTMNNIAAVYYQGGQLEQALEYYKRSLTIHTHFSNELNMASCYGNIGLVYTDLKQWDSAFHYHLLAQELYEKTGNLKGIASTLTNVALLYIDRKEYSKALDNLQTALLINIRLDEGSEIALTEQYIGHVYLLQGNLAEALSQTNKSWEICQKLDIAKQKMEVSKQLSLIYHQLGNYEKAFERISQYNTLRDSIFDEEQRVKIARMMEKYEIEKREHQIFLLTSEKENTELKLQRNNILVWSLLVIFMLITMISWLLFNRFRMKRNQLQLALEWKAADIEHRLVHSQLNPHAISNSLQTIRTLLIQENVSKANQYLDKFSGFLKLILTASRHSFITLDKEIELITAYLEIEQVHLNIKMDFRVTIDPLLESESIELPSMFIQPFVENAVKHGLVPLEKKGFIQIGFVKKDENLLCFIQDNGIGRKKAEERKQNKHALFPSLGNQLIKDRIELLHKLEHLDISIQTIDLYDTSGTAEGTRVEIKIPLNELDLSEH